MNCLDLFAGAGGLTEGFVRAGFNMVAHIEKEKPARAGFLVTSYLFRWISLFKKNKSIRNLL